MMKICNLAIVLMFLFFFLFINKGLAEIYKYVDKDGTVSYTDNIQSVPEEYRDKAVLMEDLPENIVRRTPNAIEKVIIAVKDFALSKKIIPILVAIPALIISLKMFSFLFKKNKKRIRLFFKKNKPVESRIQSGRLCTGVKNCLYPNAIEKIHRQESTSLGEITSVEQMRCRYKQSETGSHNNPKIFMPEQHKRYADNDLLCYHPAESRRVIEWRCYKCNSIVSTERERHC